MATGTRTLSMTSHEVPAATAPATASMSHLVVHTIPAGMTPCSMSVMAQAIVHLLAASRTMARALTAYTPLMRRFDKSCLTEVTVSTVLGGVYETAEGDVYGGENDRLVVT